MSKYVNVDIPMDFADRSHEALVSVWWTSTLLKKLSRRFFKVGGTSEAQFNLMMALKYSSKPLTQQELSDKLMVDKSNVTGLLDRLAIAGFIRRKKVASDRRRYHVELTAAGRKRIGKLDSSYAAKVASIMSGFTSKQQDELIALTRKLRVALAESDL